MLRFEDGASELMSDLIWWAKVSACLWIRHCILNCSFKIATMRSVWIECFNGLVTVVTVSSGSLAGFAMESTRLRLRPCSNQALLQRKIEIVVVVNHENVEVIIRLFDLNQWVKALTLSSYELLLFISLKMSVYLSTFITKDWRRLVCSLARLSSHTTSSPNH